MPPEISKPHHNSTGITKQRNYITSSIQKLIKDKIWAALQAETQQANFNTQYDTYLHMCVIHSYKGRNTSLLPNQTSLSTKQLAC
jgi:hypothetical protein